MRYLSVLLLLAGCATEGDTTCISAGYFAGDTIKDVQTGRVGTVKRVLGPSWRCSNTAFPKRAEVQWD